MSNKISLRRIKSFLSLRAKRRSNLNFSGFSLIELMVAVAILAMVIFGIFLAFSTGFQGMVDARNRTVATNYAQEAMEDIKNMDFEKIITTTKSVISSNTKYRVDVNVSMESANLKKVHTVVSWKDRNGIGKTVDSTMLVNFMEVFALAPAKIVLFADSYAILNNGGTTLLTAVIKDIKGNTVTDWDEGDISFSIMSGTAYGTISDVTPTTNGIAKATFTSNGTVGAGEIGVNVIKASVYLPILDNTVTDSVTIKITDGPVKIALTANPNSIKAGTNKYSTITVSLCNAVNQILKKSELVTDIEINFSVFGEGNLSTTHVTIPFITGSLEDASAVIILNSNGTPGLASVVATATDLESDAVDVRFLGSPVSILISANPNPIYVDDIGGSTITVSLLDINGFATNPNEGTSAVVNLALSTTTNGSLSSSSLTFVGNDFEGIQLTTIFSGQTSTAPVTITTENAIGLTNNSVTINILSALVPDHIKLTANPQIVQVGGTSTITATVYNVSGKKVSNYTGTITFSTSLGSFTGSNPTTTTDGVATIALSSGTPGPATVTVSSSDSLGYLPTGGVTVGFYGDAHHITLTANPKYVKAGTGNTSTITAKVCDFNGITVVNYTGTITFATTLGTFSGINPTTTTNGVATIELSYNVAGTATITVSSSDSLPTGGAEVVFYEETTLELVENSAKYYPANLEVVFEVKVIGEDILVDEMKILWTPIQTPKRRFQKIVINDQIVYTGNDLNGITVDIVDKILIAGESYIVKLTFGKDVAENNFTVTFYPYTLWYEVTFIPITQ